MKVALVSSPGGHLTELIALLPALEGHERFWIINDRSPVLPPREKAFVVSHAERDLLVLWNLVEFASIFGAEKPDLLLSTGAGPAVPAAVVGRLAGIPVVYVEPSSAVTQLTLTGRLMRPLASAYFVQWQELLQQAPWARYEGSVL
jgi:beta-1,4-N-acetylglucosaminyltransferase